MTFRCGYCGFRVTVSDRRAGHNVPCPACLREVHVPEVLHRERLEALSALQSERALTSAEWDEVATHLAAIGERRKGELAELSAKQTLGRETEHRVETAVPDMVEAIDALEVQATLAAEGGEEGMRRGWLTAGGAGVLALILAAVQPHLIPLVAGHLAGAAAVAVSVALRGRGLSGPLAAATWATPPLGWWLAEQRQSREAAALPLSEHVGAVGLAALGVVAWLTGLLAAIALYAQG